MKLIHMGICLHSQGSYLQEKLPWNIASSPMYIFPQKYQNSFKNVKPNVEGNSWNSIDPVLDNLEESWFQEKYAAPTHPALKRHLVHIILLSFLKIQSISPNFLEYKACLTELINSLRPK